MILKSSDILKPALKKTNCSCFFAMFLFLRRKRGKGKRQQARPQLCNCPLSTFFASYLARAPPCSILPSLYLLGIKLIISSVWPKALWQLNVLILIVWLLPPLPSEQITATIEFFFFLMTSHYIFFQHICPFSMDF